MTEAKFRFDKGMGKTVLALLVFAAVVALCLGLVDRLTARRIADYKAAKTQAAMQAVLPAEEYSPLSYSGDPSVIAVFRGGEAGWIFEVTPSGFGGLIDMLVGIDGSGAVTGVSIVDMSETSGLGANAMRESFREQYIGSRGSVALRQFGGKIDGMTGATVTSSAVTSGVNAALAAWDALMKEGN